MSIVLLLARLVLAVVFIVAGIGKLLDLKGSQKAMQDFGAPGLLAPTFGVLLPLAELAVAVALLPPASAWWGAIGAAVLLLLFVAGIAFNLTVGRKPDCHCFGVFYSSTISKTTLIRNLVLAAIAGIIIWQGHTDAGPSMVAWIANLTIAEGIGLIVGIIVIALLAFESWMLLAAVRQIGKLIVRIETLETAPAANPDVHGLPEGADAPRFELPDLSGELVSLNSLLAHGKPIVLMFTDPNCNPCTAMMPELGKWIQDHSNLLTFATISRGTPEENLAKTAEHGVAPVLLQQDREMIEAYLVRGTPSALIIRPDGSISTSLAEGEDDIRELIKDAVYIPVLDENEKRKLLPVLNVKGQPNQFAFAQPGYPAPDLTLPDLDGHMIKLSDFLGSPTLLLYWSPGCGFCQAMLRELKAWEARPPKGAPQLLVVTDGSAKEMKGVGFRSTVVIDEHFSAAPVFNIKGTPTTVLIDEEGNFTNQRADNAPGFFKLANSVRSKPKPATV